MAGHLTPSQEMFFSSAIPSIIIFGENMSADHTSPFYTYKPTLSIPRQAPFLFLAHLLPPPQPMDANTPAPCAQWLTMAKFPNLPQ